MEWRPVVGYRGLYEVSDEGQVRTAKGKLLTGWIRDGYRLVSLSKKGSKRNHGVHVLVLKAFKRKCVKPEQACHGNGKRDDNRLSNLRWGTAKSNARDKRRHGTQPYGVAVHNAKLSESMVIELRSRHAKGEKIAPLAREYGVNYYTVSNVIYRKTWKHIHG